MLVVEDVTGGVEADDDATVFAESPIDADPAAGEGDEGDDGDGAAVSGGIVDEGDASAAFNTSAGVLGFSTGGTNGAACFTIVLSAIVAIFHHPILSFLLLRRLTVGF